MNNEKLIIEMLQNLTTSMDGFKTELKQDVSDVRTELSDFKKEVTDRFDQVDNRLDQVEFRLGAVENKINSMGEMFEHTVELQQEAIAKVDETLQYHKHKIVEHDQELFTMKHKQ